MVDDPVSKDGAEPMRLVVDLNALRRYDAAETMQFIKRPMDYVAAFQEAAAEVCLPQPYRAHFASFSVRASCGVCTNFLFTLESRRVFEIAMKKTVVFLFRPWPHTLRSIQRKAFVRIVDMVLLALKRSSLPCITRVAVRLLKHWAD